MSHKTITVADVRNPGRGKRRLLRELLDTENTFQDEIHNDWHYNKEQRGY